MKASVYIDRDRVEKYLADIKDTRGLKGGSLLSIDVETLLDKTFFECEGVFVEVGNVQIIGTLVQYGRSARGSGFTLILRKVEIKEIPGLSLFFDKDKKETKTHVPEERTLTKREVKKRLREVVGYTKHRNKLRIGVVVDDRISTVTRIEDQKRIVTGLNQIIETLEGEDSDVARGLVLLAETFADKARAENAQFRTIRAELEELKKVEAYLSSVVEGMEVELKELVENYIPDLSTELGDES